MRFTPNHLITDLDAFSSFSACCALNRAFCVAASLPSLTDMLVCCATDPLMWIAGKVILTSLSYPLAKVAIRGGGNGWAVLTEAAAESPNERARNNVFCDAFTASPPSVAMAGYMNLKYVCHVTCLWLKNKPPKVWGTGQFFFGLDSLNVGVACNVRSHFSNVGVRGDRDKDGRCGRDMDVSFWNVEYCPIRLCHVTVVGDQLALGSE